MNSDLFGLTVRLDRLADREQPCCRNVAVIEPGKGPHAGRLVCTDCGQHRGWLSKSTAAWIENVIAKFGAPTTSIVVRKIHTFEGEEPDTNTNSR